MTPLAMILASNAPIASKPVAAAIAGGVLLLGLLVSWTRPKK